MLQKLKASTKKLPGGILVESMARSYKLKMEIGGFQDAMNPLEALLCALGASRTMMAYAFAGVCGFNMEEFHMELEGDFDHDGFLGVAHVRKGFSEIRYTMYFKTDETMERTREFAQFMEEYCPVSDNLLNGVNIVLADIVINKP